MTHAVHARVTSVVSSCLTAVALTTSGCASLGAPSPYVADPRLDFPVFAYHEGKEESRRAAEDVATTDGADTPSLAAVGFGAPTGEGAPASTLATDEISTSEGEVMQADGLPPRDTTLDPRWRKASPALFWTGIAVGSLGGAFLLGGGITGSVTQRQVSGAYDDGATKADIDRLVARGEVSNDFVIAGSVLALAGYALAVVVAGIDEKRCGSVLRKARRRECERR